MNPSCPRCGRPQGAAGMPVCVHCGARLGEPAAAAQAATAAVESRAALAARYFRPAVAYRRSTPAYLVELAAPFLVPLAAYALTLSPSGEPAPSWRWLCWVTGAIALVTSGAVAVRRRPGRTAIVLDKRGVRAAGCRYEWSELLAVDLLATARPGRPEQVRLTWRDGRTTTITRELAATARLSSLANLAALLGELRDAA